MVIELLDVQFWSKIILVISNRTSAARLFDFEITRMISDQIALHSGQLSYDYLLHLYHIKVHKQNHNIARHFLSCTGVKFMGKHFWKHFSERFSETVGKLEAWPQSVQVPSSLHRVLGPIRHNADVYPSKENSSGKVE